MKRAKTANPRNRFNVEKYLKKAKIQGKKIQETKDGLQRIKEEIETFQFENQLKQTGEVFQPKTIYTDMIRPGESRVNRIWDIAYSDMTNPYMSEHHHALYQSMKNDVIENRSRKDKEQEVTKRLVEGTSPREFQKYKVVGINHMKKFHDEAKIPDAYNPDNADLDKTVQREYLMKIYGVPQQSREIEMGYIEMPPKQQKPHTMKKKRIEDLNDGSNFQRLTLMERQDKIMKFHKKQRRLLTKGKIDNIEREPVMRPFTARPTRKISSARDKLDVPLRQLMKVERLNFADDIIKQDMQSVYQEEKSPTIQLLKMGTRKPGQYNNQNMARPKTTRRSKTFKETNFLALDKQSDGDKSIDKIKNLDDIKMFEELHQMSVASEGQIDEEDKQEKKSIDIEMPEDSLNSTLDEEKVQMQPMSRKKLISSAKVAGVLGAGNEEFMNNPVFAAMRDVIEKDPDTDTLSKL